MLHCKHSLDFTIDRFSQALILCLWLFMHVTIFSYFIFLVLYILVSVMGKWITTYKLITCHKTTSFEACVKWLLLETTKHKPNIYTITIKMMHQLICKAISNTIKRKISICSLTFSYKDDALLLNYLHYCVRFKVKFAWQTGWILASNCELYIFLQ